MEGSSEEVENGNGKMDLLMVRRWFSAQAALALLLMVRPGWAQWQTLSPMPTSRYGACAVVWKDWIYVMGGKNRSGVMETVERYNPANDEWDTNFPSLKEARANAAAAVYDGKIFIIGGENEHEALEEVEYFDPEEQQWKEFEELKLKRSAAAAVVFQNRLVVIGGTDQHGNYLNQVEYYDEDEKKWKFWKELTLPLNRSSMGAEVLEDSLYLIGGFYHGPIGTIDRFTFSFGWQTIGSLSRPRGDLATALLGDTLYAMGGLGFNQAEDSMEIWSIHTRRALEEQTMTIPRHGLASVTYKGDIFLFGGNRDQWHHSSPLNLAEKYTPVISDIRNLAGRDRPPNQYLLITNYPNPMHHDTHFRIETSGFRPGTAFQLTVFNLLGREVWRFQGVMKNRWNTIPWDGRDLHGIEVGSGLYLYQLRVGERVLMRKLTVVHE